MFETLPSSPGPGLDPGPGPGPGPEPACRAVGRDMGSDEVLFAIIVDAGIGNGAVEGGDNKILLKTGRYTQRRHLWSSCLKSIGISKSRWMGYGENRPTSRDDANFIITERARGKKKKKGGKFRGWRPAMLLYIRVSRLGSIAIPFNLSSLRSPYMK